MTAREKMENTLKAMLCEMPYEKITVKSLTGRAGVNRNTFYLYYNSLDDMLEKIQKEIADHYTEKTRRYDRMKDTEILTRIFLAYVQEQGAFGEFLWGEERSSYMYNRISNETRKECWPAEQGKSVREIAYKNIVLYYIQLTTVKIYRQWLRDGKPIPMEELTELIVGILCRGIETAYKYPV